MADWTSGGGDVWNTGPSNDGWESVNASQGIPGDSDVQEKNWNDKGAECGGQTTCNGCGQTDHTIETCPNGTAAAGNQAVQYGDDACFGCGETGHRRAECPKGSDVECFGCGETGHRRAECPKGSEIECRNCKNTGHMAKDCPDKPAMTCNNCGEEGHAQNSCGKPRKINRDNVADISPEDAWEKIKEAVADSDIDDAKDAIQEYVKALDGTPTYKEIQMGLIDAGINLWFISLERVFPGAFTNMDLQGNVGKKYTVSYRFSEKPARPREREGWPQTRDEILARLDDAGERVDSLKQRCFNCEEFGHSTKTCPEPKRERVEEAVVCNNCQGEGHRQRDCPQPRVDKFACKNCGKSGHKAAECEEPPNLDNITCRKCEETGHLSKDCPQGGGGRACHNCGQEGHIAKECDQPRNMDTVTCRNCEKTGHVSRDCPEPKDWSKVKCSNCQQFGHTKVRCKEPTAEEPDFENSGGGFDNGSGRPAEDSRGEGNAAATFDDAGDFKSGSGGW